MALSIQSLFLNPFVCHSEQARNLSSLSDGAASFLPLVEMTRGAYTIHMDPLGKKELLLFYDRHLRDFGDSPQAVRWTQQGQTRRYETLCKISGNLSGKSILDFGCGKGDFYGFLKCRGISVNYLGIDINENLVGLAGRKYPEAEFMVADIEEEDLGRAFDVVFVCGVFNLRIAGIDESMKSVLRRLFSLCGEALHANFLTYYVPRRSVELFYVKPEEILQFVITGLSGSVTLRQEEEDIFLSVFRSHGQLPEKGA